MRSIWILLGSTALYACAQAPAEDDNRPAVYAACERTQPTGSRLTTHVCWTAEQKAMAESDARTAKDHLARTRPAPVPKDAQVRTPRSR